MRRPHRGTSTALLGLGLIQIAIAIGIGIDFLLSRSAGFFRFPTRRHAALDMIPGSPGTARPTRRHAALDLIPGSPPHLLREIQRVGFYRRRRRESKRAQTRAVNRFIRVPPTQHALPAPPGGQPITKIEDEA